MFEITNNIGEIHFSDSVVKSVIKDAVDFADGNARLLNYKGKYATAVPGNAQSFVISETEDGIEMTLYIVVKFGKSISSVSNAIIDRLYFNMEHMLGARPKSVKVVVTGVESKDIARRNLEFIR